MFLFKVQSQVQSDLFFSTLLYICFCYIKNKKKSYVVLGYFINHYFHRCRVHAETSHTRHTKKNAYKSAYIHNHLDLHQAEQTSHGVQLQLRTDLSSTKCCHWQPKGLWKPPHADPSLVWFSCWKRSKIKSAAQYEKNLKLKQKNLPVFLHNQVSHSVTVAIQN